MLRPRRPETRRRARWPRPPRATLAAPVLALAVLLLVPTPLAGEPRPPLGEISDTDRFVPPVPVTDERFATYEVRGPGGEPGLWLLPRQIVPLRFQVEREVADRFGLDAIEEAVGVFNDTSGTRFGAEVTGVVHDGVERRQRDGVNRIFLDRDGCGDRYLARAHLWSDPIRVSDGRAIRDVREVDIGLCDRLSAARLAAVVRHELAHIAGLDHLCDPGEDCHRPGMGDDNRCRIMYPQLHPCQEVSDGDLDALVHLYPRLPRAGGGDARSATARSARVTHPAPRSALRTVVTAHDAPPARQVLAATLAGHLDVPHLLVDEDCTSGPVGAALNRALALTGTVTSVGAVPAPCRTALERSWQLEVEELTSIGEVVAAMVEDAELVPRRLVVAPAPQEDGRRLPEASLGGAAAVALEAPLVVLGPDGGTQAVLDALERFPTLAEVVVIGEQSSVATLDLGAVAEAGVATRRVTGADLVGTARAVALLPLLDGRRPLGAAVVGHDHPEHAAAAVSLAAGVDGIVVPVSREPTPRQLRLLDQHVSRGVIVGGPQAVNHPAQLALSRAVDGQR